MAGLMVVLKPLMNEAISTISVGNFFGLTNIVVKYFSFVQLIINASESILIYIFKNCFYKFDDLFYRCAFIFIAF